LRRLKNLSTHRNIGRIPYIDDSMQIIVGRLKRMSNKAEFENWRRIPMQLFEKLVVLEINGY